MQRRRARDSPGRGAAPIFALFRPGVPPVPIVEFVYSYDASGLIMLRATVTAPSAGATPNWRSSGGGAGGAGAAGVA